jgi:hypothetical protein
MPKQLKKVQAYPELPLHFQKCLISANPLTHISITILVYKGTDNEKCIPVSSSKFPSATSGKLLQTKRSFQFEFVFP